MKTESLHSRRKVRSAFIPVKLRDVSLSLSPFSPFPLLYNNCINNRKAIKLSFLHSNKVVLMQIGLSGFGFSMVTNYGNKLYKSNRAEAQVCMQAR